MVLSSPFLSYPPGTEEIVNESQSEWPQLNSVAEDTVAQPEETTPSWNEEVNNHSIKQGSFMNKCFHGADRLSL